MAAIGARSVCSGYGRSPSLQNRSPSTPLSCNMSKSRRRASTIAPIPPLLSYSGRPGKGSKCIIAITGLGRPKSLSSTETWSLVTLDMKCPPTNLDACELDRIPACSMTNQGILMLFNRDTNTSTKRADTSACGPGSCRDKGRGGVDEGAWCLSWLGCDLCAPRSPQGIALPPGQAPGPHPAPHPPLVPTGPHSVVNIHQAKVELENSYLMTCP